MQIQFVGIMVHAFQLLFIDCNYPRAFVWWIGMHAVMFFFLFKEFYNQAYNNRKPPKGGAIAVEANGHTKLNGTLPQNGISSKKGTASEYYMNGTSEISQRIKSQWWWLLYNCYLFCFESWMWWHSGPLVKAYLLNFKFVVYMPCWVIK